MRRLRIASQSRRVDPTDGVKGPDRDRVAAEFCDAYRRAVDLDRGSGLGSTLPRVSGTFCTNKYITQCTHAGILATARTATQGERAARAVAPVPIKSQYLPPSAILGRVYPSVPALLHVAPSSDSDAVQFSPVCVQSGGPGGARTGVLRRPSCDVLVVLLLVLAFLFHTRAVGPGDWTASPRRRLWAHVASCAPSTRMDASLCGVLDAGLALRQCGFRRAAVVAFCREAWPSLCWPDAPRLMPWTSGAVLCDSRTRRELLPISSRRGSRTRRSSSSLLSPPPPAALCTVHDAAPQCPLCVRCSRSPPPFAGFSWVWRPPRRRCDWVVASACAAGLVCACAKRERPACSVSL